MNHGAQHRPELARYLTDFGRSPRELEAIDASTFRSAAQSRRRSWIDSRSLGGVGRLLPGSSERVLVDAIQSR